MKNSTNAIRIKNNELLDSSYSLKFAEINVEKKQGKLKSRLGFVYFVAVVSSLIFLFLK